MSDSMVFRLVGQDGLSPVLLRAGAAARRMDDDIDGASARSGRSLNNLTQSGGGLNTLTMRLTGTGPAIRTWGQRLDDAARNSSSGMDQLRGALTRVRGVLPGILGVAGGMGVLAAKFGAAVPAAAALAGTLQNILPAAGVAATGILAVVSAQAALKIGLSGVDEAVKLAFDPSKAAEFNEAVKKLSPNAQKFVLQLKAMGPAFSGLKKHVQDNLFERLDTTMARTGKATLPIFKSNLGLAASAMNLMGRQVLNTATRLAEDGALGKALNSATRGLFHLKALPATVVQGLVQIGAAAGPSFEQLTRAGGGAVEKLSAKLAGAFESGAMQRSIETAVGLVKQLASVVGNVGKVLGNVFSAAQTSGGGMIGVLQSITGELAKVTASPAVQSALSSLFTTMGTLGRTVAPLLGQALRAVGPVIAALGPPVQTLVKNLGSALTPVIKGLSPVLLAVATTVGGLVSALSPLLPIVGNLVGGLLGALAPVLSALGTQLGLVAKSVVTLLSPALRGLVGFVVPVVGLFGKLVAAWVGVQNKILTVLQPSLSSLGKSFGQILTALRPLVIGFTSFITTGLDAMLPVLDPIIRGVGQLASLLAGGLAKAVTGVAVPAIRAITALLKGDFGAAWRHAATAAHHGKQLVIDAMNKLPGALAKIMGRVVVGLQAKAQEAAVKLAVRFGGAVERAKQQVGKLPGKAAAALAGLGARMSARAGAELNRLVAAVGAKIGAAVARVRTLPGRARGAMAGAGGALVGVGRQMIAGLISGMGSMIGAVVSRARSIAGAAITAAKRALGVKSPSRVFHEIGRQTGRGLIQGLTSTKSKIDATADKLANAITRAFKGRRTHKDDRLVRLVQRGNHRLQRLADKRDKIAARIAEARKFAADTASTARGTGALSSLVSGEDISVGAIKGGLADKIGQLREFTRHLKMLRAKGLNKNMLRQILEMGPEQGAAYANALAGAGKGTIRGINALQSTLGKQSKSLGRFGADALYDSGKKAGRGFLAGLAAQKKSIESLMVKIAKGMQKAIRRALGIRSPSRVMAEVGRQSTLGLAVGLTRPIGAVDRAMGQVAAAVAGTTPRVPVALPATRAAGGGTVIHIHVDGTVMDPMAVAKKIQKVLLEKKRVQGGKGLGFD